MKKIIFIMLLLISSCKSGRGDIEKFKYHLFDALIGTSRISLVHKIFNQEITRPPGVEINILNIDSHGPCYKSLHYTVPSLDKSRPGSLKLIETCKVDEGKLISRLDGVKSFAYYLGRDQKMKFKINAEDIAFPLLNLKRKSNGGLLSSSSDLRFYKGLYLKMGTSLPSGVGVGEYGDNFKDRTSKICHEVDDNCNEKMSNRCSTCQYGFYEVAGKRSCKFGSSKYCGIDRCGENGFPACRRHGIPNDGRDICRDDSPLFFCNKGLSVYCVNNQVICL